MLFLLENFLRETFLNVLYLFLWCFFLWKTLNFKCITFYSKAKLDFFSILSKKKNYWKTDWACIEKMFQKVEKFCFEKKNSQKLQKKGWCFWRRKGWPCSWLKMRIWHKTWRAASSALKQYAWKNMFLKVGCRKHVVFLTKLDFVPNSLYFTEFL